MNLIPTEPGPDHPEGERERDAEVVRGQADVEAERAAAEAELRTRVSELASGLAGRLVGEPLGATVTPTEP